MANNYLEFSEVIPRLTAEEEAWLHMSRKARQPYQSASAASRSLGSSSSVYSRSPKTYTIFI